jgi:hypothetical protein
MRQGVVMIIECALYKVVAMMLRASREKFEKWNMRLKHSHI